MSDEMSLRGGGEFKPIWIIYTRRKKVDRKGPRRQKEGKVPCERIPREPTALPKRSLSSTTTGPEDTDPPPEPIYLQELKKKTKGMQDRVREERERGVEGASLFSKGN